MKILDGKPAKLAHFDRLGKANRQVGPSWSSGTAAPPGGIGNKSIRSPE